MVYLVGGAPRAGKSNLAAKFTRDTGIPFFSIDYLKMGLARGVPGLGIDPLNDDLLTARQLRPIVEGMTRTYVENEDDCLLEGSYLLTEYIATLCDELGNQIQGCCLAYADIDPAEKIRQMGEHVREGHRDWMGEDDEETVQNMEHLKAFSITIRDECSRHRVKYFESVDYLKTIDQAIHFWFEHSHD